MFEMGVYFKYNLEQDASLQTKLMSFPTEPVYPVCVWQASYANHRDDRVWGCVPPGGER